MNHLRNLFVLAFVGLTACQSSPPLVTRPADAPATLLVRNTNVLNVRSGEIDRDRDVLIENGRIAKITAGGELGADPGIIANAFVIPGAGTTLLPGLIDAHGHIASSSSPPWVTEMPDAEGNLLSYLYSGVTTVLDPADMSGEGVERRGRVASGELLGPTIFTAGRIVTAVEGHPIYMINRLVPWFLRWYVRDLAAVQISTTEEARAAAREMIDGDVDFLKVAVDSLPDQAPRLEAALITEAVGTAKASGLRSVAHIGALADAIDAADAGVAAWVHGVYKQRLTDDDVSKLASYEIPVVVTMAVFENYALMGQQERVPTRLEIESVDAATLESFNDVPTDGFQAEFVPYLEALREQRPNWRANTLALHKAGVTILAGSDTQAGMFAGPGLHRELALLVEAGLTEAEAIRAATWNTARFLASSDDPDFGVVAEGKRADLLLVDGNPLDDLERLAAIRAVIKDGVVLGRRPVSPSL